MESPQKEEETGQPLPGERQTRLSGAWTALVIGIVILIVILAPGLDEVRIENLKLLDASVDLLIHRHDEGVAVEVLRRRGEIEILKSL